MLIVPLSYFVAYEVGARGGRREGWQQAAMVLSPHIISKSEVCFYDWPDKELKVGTELFAAGCTYVVVFTEPREELCYAIARIRSETKASGDSPIVSGQ
jgi:hypothetical protein